MQVRLKDIKDLFKFDGASTHTQKSEHNQKLALLDGFTVLCHVNWDYETLFLFLRNIY